MSPYHAARRLFDLLPQDRIVAGWGFDRTMDWYAASGGFIFSTPDYFAMGRHVSSKSAPELIEDAVSFPRSVSDAWFVHAMAGDLSKVWACIPWELPLIGFNRSLKPSSRPGLRFYRAEVLRRHSMRPALPQIAEASR